MNLRGADTKMLEKKGLVMAEIGVWEGTHAEEMLDCLVIKKLYLVDPYIDYKTADRIAPLSEMESIKEKANERLSKYGERIVWIIKTSAEASKDIGDGTLDYVYIDACHRYRNAFQDLSLWVPKVKEGGLVGGHDWTTQPVREAVEDYCQDNKIEFENDGSDWWFIKQ